MNNSRTALQKTGHMEFGDFGRKNDAKKIALLGLTYLGSSATFAPLGILKKKFFISSSNSRDTAPLADAVHARFCYLFLFILQIKMKSACTSVSRITGIWTRYEKNFFLKFQEVQKLRTALSKLTLKGRFFSRRFSPLNGQIPCAQFFVDAYMCQQYIASNNLNGNNNRNSNIKYNDSENHI